MWSDLIKNFHSPPLEMNHRKRQADELAEPGEPAITIASVASSPSTPQ